MSPDDDLRPGTIVSPPDHHDPARGVRYGVVLAPPPSEQVERVCSGHPAVWRPAVLDLCVEVWPAGEYPGANASPNDPPADEQEDGTASSRCDYCGRLFSIDRAAVHWTHTYTSDEGQGVFTTGIYCSDPCGEWASNRLGTSRG